MDFQEIFETCYEYTYYLVHFILMMYPKSFREGGGFSVQRSIRGCATEMGPKISLLV